MVGAVFAACITAVGTQSLDDLHCDRNNSSPDLPCLERVLGEVDEMFRAEKEAAHIPGVLYGIMQDGKLIHSAALGLANVERSIPVDLTTRFRIASMSKSFTALAVLQLRDAGRLSLDDPVAKYVPELRQLPASPRAEDSPRLTVRHLLTHTGGMPQEDPWVSPSTA